ncbi:SDR family NAD(P)-dependent oxidoreductase [Taibaiella soli]|uniref:SDR family NAD(P)-dependent oxidoreductase n=1 Tax=Taibaiella soli TaxID=1649169 RepID=UPI001401FAE1|nr:SDR family oxidoreductase [Taibaiella soli]
MKVVVITGGTKGIGYGLAEAFLARGCSVVICSRSIHSVEAALETLQEKYTSGRVIGMACDVANYESVMALWNLATESYGKVHIWINNAGQSHPRKSIWQQTPERLRSVVDTNLLGAMNGSSVAIRGMMEQGFGNLYNMLGLGSNGMKVKGYGLYSSTKYAMRYFTETLIKDMAKTNVQVGTILPGMVLTDLLVGNDTEDPEQIKKLKWIFRVLADKVETVTPWIADQLLLNNNTNGSQISWLTKQKIFFRFLTAPFRKRNLDIN